MTLWQQFMVTFRRIPGTLDLALAEWLRDFHWAEDFDGEPRCMARTHKSDLPLWPCDEYLSLDRRVDEVLERMPR